MFLIFLAVCLLVGYACGIVAAVLMVRIGFIPGLSAGIALLGGVWMVHEAWVARQKKTPAQGRG
jgi:hypothetical protein